MNNYQAPGEDAMPDQSSASSGPGSPGQIAAVWARVRGRLQGEVGEVEYRTWLKHMTLVGIRTTRR